MVWTLALASVALADTAVTGSLPVTVEHVVLASTTDWNRYTCPSRSRLAAVQNNNASASLYWGRYDETGTFSAANDEYLIVAAGQTLWLPISAGSSAAPSTHLVVALASSTASHAAAVVCAEASP